MLQKVSGKVQEGLRSPPDPLNNYGPGAGAGSPWARGLGAPGPKLQDIRGECNYLLSGRLSAVSDLHPTTAYMHPNVSTYRLPTVRQSYLLSGRLSAVSEMHPKGIYMDPNVSIYFAPTTATANMHPTDP